LASQRRAERIMDISMKFNSICRLDKAAGYVNHMVQDTIQK